MGRTPTLLSGRLDQRAMTWLMLSVLIVTPLEATTEAHPIALAALPIRAVCLAGMLVALRTGRLEPVTIGRLFLTLALASMMVAVSTSSLSPEGVALETTAYATILPIFALLIAPQDTRRLWSLVTMTMVVIPAVARLLPDHPSLFVQTATILLVHSAAVAVLDVHTNKAERAGAMASIDPLTGLTNRRLALQRLEASLDESGDLATTATVMILDLDHFKDVNDTLGHDAGDRALCEIADILRSGVRPIDTVCRWGGEEFLILLPGADEAAACEAAERLRVQIAETAVTASFGLATRTTGETVTGWVKRADDALYVAKRAGRNRVVAGPAGALSASPHRDNESFDPSLAGSNGPM